MSDLPNEPTNVANRKRAELEQKGMREIGTVLIDPATGLRATIDYWGRVDWAEPREFTDPTDSGQIGRGCGGLE